MNKPKKIKISDLPRVRGALGVKLVAQPSHG